MPLCPKNEMNMKELLRQIIYEQRSTGIKNIIPRDIDDKLVQSPDILVITGVRRCGKSTLMQQIRKNQKQKDFFLNFDDERLINFKVENFQELCEVFIEEFGEQKTYYFDEIQNVKGWERFASRLYAQGCKVFVTGSNAKMLSRELGTFLTGRHVTKELFPFSFSEFLRLKKISFAKSFLHTTAGRAKVITEFKKYLQQGGFPQYIIYENDNYLSSLYNDVVFRDIIVRNGLTNEARIRELMLYLASNAAHRYTYNFIAKLIGVKNPDTVKSYLGFIEDTYFVKQLTKYDSSVGTQMRSPKKIYFIDNAIINKIGFNASDNLGSMLENAVCVELMRRGEDIYYYSGKSECDFLCRHGHNICNAIQVCVSLENKETESREMKGLMEALVTYKLKEGTILTISEEKTITNFGKTIHVLPVWKWMLG